MANPIEPPPFRTARKPPQVNRFADVRGGASNEQVSTGFPPPEPESYLRYDLGDGQGMREFQRGQEPTHGTFSMMTAPENVNRVTAASQMEDFDTNFRLAQMRRANMMMQPYEPGTQLPPLTVGEMVQREDGQQTLRRLEARDAEIDRERRARVEARMPGALTDDQRRNILSEEDQAAWQAYQRALMAEQLAMGKGLPGSVYDRRY